MLADTVNTMHHEISFIQNLVYAAILIGLAFTLITGVLYTLAYHMNRAIRIHNLVRETKQLRAEYQAHRNRHQHKNAA